MDLKMYTLGRPEMFFFKKVMNRSHCIRSFSCPGFWPWRIELSDLLGTVIQLMLKKTSFLCELFKGKISFVNDFSQKRSVFNLNYNAPAGKSPYFPIVESGSF